ncbi:unnamed protein product [Symbiodinium sp. CCMP2592]|nr:unnamed protein product [Symbiodinium sp. CCMP2592]
MRSDLPDSPDWGDSDAELDAEIAGEQGLVWPGDDCPEPPDRGDGESDGEAASLADLSPPEFAKYLPDASSSASAAKPVHPSLDFKAGHAAEQAIRMLDDDDFEKKQIKPREPPHTAKSEELPYPQGAFYAGMYRKGNGISGLRKSCREFPLSVAAINAFMARAVPTASYNAFAILDNVASPAHRDLQNEPVASHVLALSAFAGGGIWVQCPRGAVCRRVAGVNTPGKVLSLDKGPVQLDAASSLHSTEPWQGDRVILSCYTLKGYDLLTSDQCNSLLQLSFPLPLQVGQCARPSPVDYAALRAATGTQPKASKTVPLVPEHRAVIVVRGPAQLLQPPCVLRQRLEADWAVPTSCTCAWPSIPKYSQLLRSDLLDVEVKEGSSGKVLELAWGTPSEFVDCAVAAGHPSLLEANLPQELQDAITDSSKMTPKNLASHRLRVLKEWSRRAKDLEKDEKAFKSSFHPEVRPILAPKRLLLFKSLLQEYGYPDLDAFNELVSGVSLTGDAPHTGIFNAAERHASMSEAELKAKAKVIQQEVLGKVTSQGSEIDAIVKQKTAEEVQKGWLVGPFEIEDLPEHAIISKRFGLPQASGKTRLIDDFSISHVNESVGAGESPKPHTADVLCAMTLQAMRAFPGRKFVGRAYDLQAAYRQVPVHPSSSWASYVAYYDCDEKRPRIYRCRALPFGATKSVYGFLRISHALWWLGVVALKLAWSLYYDDFVVLSESCLASNTNSSIQIFFTLLGWAFAREGSKAEPFNSIGRSALCNTESRTNEFCTSIRAIMDAGTLTKSAALKLRGRMQFACGQVFGRLAKVCLKHLTDFAYGDLPPNVPANLLHALQGFCGVLKEASPRLVQVMRQEPMFVFTDACFEPSASDWKCGIGGVLFNHRGDLIGSFSHSLCSRHQDLLGAQVQKTIIFPAELLALLCGMRLWLPALKGRPTVFFVDNNCARDVCISGSGRAAVIKALLQVLLKDEESAGIASWYQRVPSPSNPADDPSRRKCHHVTVGRKTVKCTDVEEIVEKIFFEFEANKGSLL